jgi:hypothetical protein
MKLVVLIFLLFTSCINSVSNVPLQVHDNVPVSFITNQGIVVKNVSGNPLNKEQIENAIDLLGVQLSKRFPGTYPSFMIQAAFYASAPVVIFEKDYIPCKQNVHGMCEGLTELDKNVIHVVWHDCIGDTSLTHELLHLLQYHIEGVSDSEHDRSDFFINTKNVNKRNSSSIESYVTWELKFFGCGK